MDLSRIPLVKLAQAYGLQYQECRGLAEKLQAQAEYYEETLSLAEIDKVANGLPSKIDLRVLMLDEFEQYLKINSILLPEIYRDHIAGGRIFRWTNELRHIAILTFAAYLIGIATVEKEAAIRYLHENGYSLVMEMQGLSKQFVQRIIGQENSGEQSASAAAGTSGADNKLDAEAIIPRELWAQQDLHDVVAGMRARGYPDDAIAYAIFTGCKLTNKNEIGKLLFPHNNYDKKTHERKIRNFLNNPTKKWRLE